MWNEESEFDENKDKSQFRDYDAACDRVKMFYKEQHGKWSRRIVSLELTDHRHEHRKTDCGV